MTYSFTDIQVLEGNEAIRKRPGMYIGPLDEKVATKILQEIVTKSLADGCSRLSINILGPEENYRVMIIDDGPGWDMSVHEKFSARWGRTVTQGEILLTQLHAGGMFDLEDNVNYNMVMYNALSSRFDFETWWNGEIWKGAFSCGKLIGLMEKLGSTRAHGTTITYELDGTIFPFRAVNPKEFMDWLVKRATPGLLFSLKEPATGWLTRQF